MFCVRSNCIKKIITVTPRLYSNKIIGEKTNSNKEKYDFVTVFSFPFVSSIARLSRVKVYQLLASTLAIPGCGLLEFMEILPVYSTAVTAYIGITTTAVLSLFSWPTVNIIGKLYVSKDKQKIKISYLDFWGRRVDKVIDTADWIPLMSTPARKTDSIYLTPCLADGSKYKLFIKYGNVFDKKIIGEVLE